MIFLGFASLPCLAESERAALAGLGGVKLIVDIDCERAAGLSESAVRRDIDQLLRRQRLVVLTESQWAETTGRPGLRLEVECGDGPAKTTIYAATLELEQTVRLARDPSTVLSAPTWSSPTRLGALSGDVAGGLRDVVRELIELFLTDYAKANGRR